MSEVRRAPDSPATAVEVGGCTWGGFGPSARSTGGLGTGLLGGLLGGALASRGRSGAAGRRTAGGRRTVGGGF